MSNRQASGLALNIRTAAQHADMTVLALSGYTGIPYPTLNRKLNVKPETFTVQELTKIAAALEVGFETLLTETAA